MESSAMQLDAAGYPLDGADDCGAGGAGGGQGSGGGGSGSGSGGDRPSGGRAGERDDDEENGHADKKQRRDPACALKVLIANNVAGSLIGKGGSNIQEIQTQSGAMVRVSANNMFFPGTQDRVVLISGDLVDVKLAAALVLTRIHQVPSSEVGGQPSAPSPHQDLQQRLLVPSAAGGLVIGRGGSNIKAISEASGAKLILAAKDGLVSNERVAILQGPLHAIQAGVQVLLDKLQEDSQAAKYTNMSVNYRVNPMHPDMGAYGHIPAMAGYGGYHHPLPPAAAGYGAAHTGPQLVQVLDQGQAAALGSTPASTTIPLAIPDSMVGVILGKGGQTIAELQQLSGARITVSQRGEFVPGTNNRTVTITGTPMAAQTAQYLITNKINASQAQNQSQEASRRRND